jgi:hypothetical protein
MFLWRNEGCGRTLPSGVRIPVSYGTQRVFCSYSWTNPPHGAVPSVNEVFSLVIQEEKQQEISLKTQSFGLESAALMTRSDASMAQLPK